MKRSASIPSQERLSALFLCRDDGRLVRKVSVGAAKAGSVAGFLRADGYRAVWVDGCRMLEHLVVWIISNGAIRINDVIDHADLDKQNNRLSNLRLANHTLNRANERALKNNKLGVKGVHFARNTQLFRAQIKMNGRKTWLGDFETINEAAEAYQRAAVRYFGEFARVS